MNNNSDFAFQTELGPAPQYTFLSQPPPPKRRLVQPPAASPPSCALPLPPIQADRRRSSLTATIFAWVSHVHPGSPAPASPHRRLSNSSRRPSGNLCLSAGIGHGRIPSSPVIATPTPTTASHKTFDFTAIGYNTVFVHIPKTPETPSPLLRAKAEKELQVHQEKLREKARAKEGKQEKRGRMIKKIRSLANLRPRTKPTSRTESPDWPVPPLPVASPTYTTATAPMPSKSITKSKPKSKSTKPKQSSTSKSKKKKAIYGAIVRPPPNLASELALMQFADGGKLDDHVKRLMTTESGVGDVYRDGKGGVWWDREEELEYRGLLVETESSDEDEAESDNEQNRGRAMSWVKFGTPTSPVAWTTEVTAANPSTVVNLDRRRSTSSASSLDSDLDPAYLMQTENSPRYHDEHILNFDLRVKAPASVTAQADDATATKPGPMLLSLPARPFRAAKHLRKPEFMVDMQAFGLATQAIAAANEVLTAKSPRSPLFQVNVPASAACASSRRRARRRPAPLEISSGMQKVRRVIAVSSPGLGVPPPSSRVMNFAQPSLVPTNVLSPLAPATSVHAANQIVKEGKHEFAMDSFQPEVSIFEDDSEYDHVQRPPLQKRTAEGRRKKRESRLDLKDVFGAGSRRE